MAQKINVVRLGRLRNLLGILLGLCYRPLQTDIRIYTHQSLHQNCHNC